MREKYMKTKLKHIGSLLTVLLSVGILQAQPMNGFYSVGPLDTYATLSDAWTDLVSRGVDGPVTLAIANGTHKWGTFYLIGTITGTSETNTISIQSFTGNPADAILADSSDNPVFGIQDTRHINVSYITIKQLKNGSGRGILLMGDTQYININNCIFHAPEFGTNTVTLLTGFVQTFDVPKYGRFWEFKYNKFYNGNTGLYYITTGSEKITQTNVEQNQFYDQKSAGIYIQGHVDSTTIYNNEVWGESSTLSWKGMYFGLTSKKDLFIHRNKVLGNDGDAALYFNASDTNSAVITNNSWVMKGSGFSVWFGSTKSVHFVHNSALKTALSGGNPVLYVNGANTNLNIVNNIFSGPGGLRVFSLVNATAVTNFDHNLFYSSLSDIGSVNNASNFFAIPTLQSSYPTLFPNAKTGSVTFVDANNANLLLGGASHHDAKLSGTDYSVVYTFKNGNVDWNGSARPEIPYMGIHEVFGAPLPVELSSFTVAKAGTDVVLNWSTTTETNNYGFEIEAQKGATWNKVGFVAGKGTTTEAQSYSFVDHSVSSGTVSYRLKQIDFDGKYEYSSIQTLELTPETFELLGNYPNPFNPTTMISFQTAYSGQVTIIVFDVLGRQVNVLLNEVKPAGVYQVPFNASGLSSGLYFYQVKAGNDVRTGRMLLSK